MLAIGMLVFLYAVWKAYKTEPNAPDNPWDAPGLEWATSSPPPEHDFDVIPIVRARDPLWYNRDNNIVQEDTKEAHIHLPPPSYYPLLISIGLLIGGIGLLSTLVISFMGILLAFYGIWGWVLEPTD
jgi:cytochrome c oxidase subunit 1